MKKVVILSGSGISVESGIPTFRAAADAMWKNYDVKKVWYIRLGNAYNKIK